MFVCVDYSIGEGMCWILYVKMDVCVLPNIL